MKFAWDISKKCSGKFFGKIGYLLEKNITMGRQIIISEEEKRNIQEMYGLVNEQTADGMTYSVVPINDKFRIYVKGGKYTEPTDAATAFGEGKAWVDYDTRQDAEKTINTIVNNTKKGGLEMIEMVND